MQFTNISLWNNLVAWSALRAIVVACVASIGLAAFRVKVVSARLFVWKSVLVAAMLMPILGLIVPPLPIQVPKLFPSKVQSITSHTDSAASISTARLNAGTVIVGREVSRPVSTVRESSILAESSSHEPIRLRISWAVAAIGSYFAILVVLLARLLIGVVLANKLVRNSRCIRDGRVSRRIAAHNHTGKAKLLVAESDCVSIPVTVGALQTAILLPTNWRNWDDAQLDAVIAHELSHVSRRDALTQYASLAHRAIFWFSPFAWWLDRHLAALAEQASDEAALASGTDRNEYAKTLLKFFETLRTTPGRVRWKGVSMANGGQAEQRLERILAWKGPVPMALKKSLIAAVAVLAVPVLYLAASARPATADASSSNQEAAPQVVPASPSLEHAPIAGVPAPGPASGLVAPKIVGVPSVPGAPAVASVAPVAPVAAYSRFASSGAGYSYSYGYDDDERFIIVSGKSDSYTMSGSSQDVHHVERLKKQMPGDFIWFQRDEKSYIIRDQATIDRAKAFWAPQEELGKKQEELGKQQEALGKQQEELGKKMEAVRVDVPANLTAKLDALKARLQKLGPTATMEDMGDLQSEIGELQSQIGEIQSRAGEQQGKLGEEQGKLGEQQGKLGEQQGKLGEEQGRLAEEAAKKMKALLDESIKNGKAQPEQQSSGGASL